MKLRLKILLVFLIISSSLFLSYLFLYSVTVKKSFAQIEAEDARVNMERIDYLLDEEIAGLARTVEDWAPWDDTYYFLMDGNEDYIDSNLSEMVFENLKLNIMLFVDNSGRIIHAQAYDYHEKMPLAVPEVIGRLTDEYEILLRHHETNWSAVDGIVMVGETPLLIAAATVLTSNYEGPAAGTLIIGRFLNEELIQTLSEKARLPVEFTEFENSAIEEQIKEELLLANDHIAIREDSTDKLKAMSVYFDLDGEPALILQANISRTITGIGTQAGNNFFLFIALFSLLFSACAYMMLDFYFFKRISQLYNDIVDIGKNGQSQKRAHVDHYNDEIAITAKEVNSMLDALEDNYRSLRDSEEKYREILSSMKDGYCEIDLTGTVTFCNQSGATLLGYTIEELTGMSYRQFCIDPAKVLHAFNQVYCSGEPNYSLILELKKKDGSVGYGEFSLTLMHSKQGEIVGFRGVGRDITDRMHLEQELKYLSFHDQLTGINNRAYFEKVLSMIDNDDYPVSIIVADVDDLKKVNDSGGHAQGDELLKACAAVLKKSVRSSDVLARVGGDEFAVILPRSGKEDAKMIIKRFNEQLELYHRDNGDLGISIGVATAQSTDQSLVETYKKADALMYRNKIHKDNAQGRHAERGFNGK